MAGVGAITLPLAFGDSWRTQELRPALTGRQKTGEPEMLPGTTPPGNSDLPTRQ